MPHTTHTGQLRVNAGINDPVTAYRRLSLPVPPHPTNSTEQEPEDDLDHDARPKDELIQMVKNLRRDLASTKCQVSNYRSVTDYLVEKRRVLVETLEIVDTLLATCAIGGVQQRSIASTARPHKIAEACEAVTIVSRESSPSPPSQSLRSHSQSRSPSPQRLPFLFITAPLPPSSQHMSAEESATSPTSGDITDSSANEEGETDRQHSPQQGTQGASGKRRRPRRKKRATPRVETTQSRQETRREVTSARQQQARCLQCRRHGHTQDQCTRKACDYCQGRFHTSLNCRVKIADERQQELVQAVRQTSQDTLSALRGVAWQLHQPFTAESGTNPVTPPPTTPPHPRLTVCSSTATIPGDATHPPTVN